MAKRLQVIGVLSIDSVTEEQIKECVDRYFDEQGGPTIDAVRFDMSQSLTEEQKEQARVNIGITLYDGTYSVTPETDVSQILRTSGKVLDSDIVIAKIPYAEVSNNANGLTVTIGQE